MNGLEYILGLFNMQHIDLAEKLGIKKQNINLWIKGKQNVPKKYIPILEDIFGVRGEYFIKKLTDIEKLELQKEKLKQDIKPVVKKYDQQFRIGEKNELTQVPVYDKEEMNVIERTIEKAKLVERFRTMLEEVDEHPFLDSFKLVVELLEKKQSEVLLHKTMEALAHYLEVLPDWVNSEEEQEAFESEIFEVFDDHNY